MATRYDIPSHIASVTDYEPIARERLPADAFAYISGAAADELTLARNRTAFDALALKSRVLADLRGGGTALSLFGCDFVHPILVAPSGRHRLCDPHGELATLVGAGGAKAGMVVSTEADIRLEELAAAATAPLWFQLYVQHDRAYTLDVVRRAEQAGYRALVVTVDAPVHGLRNRELRAGYRGPKLSEFANLAGLHTTHFAHADLGESLMFGGYLEAVPVWEDIARLRRATKLPLILKGIMAPEDAQRALELGVDGIIVSNHGGRVLDSQPASIEALPAVVREVAGRVPVLMDGGIRRGTDVLKALALGAAAVLVGRPVLYGLAVAGPAGVAHVLHLLRCELEIAMVLTGCRTLSDIGPQVLWQPG
ncbi:alpha-hydroxy-acid oxidizing protein [Ancylobacter sp. 6x-1]|uniref:Alpha-hydroxy-acid oxidizing protein n=1 Tax=Ancylobacter crimeensis TaxID=2579147 RepID=A0ABT0DA11_9HYPH|nr:alpha-hydroxy acid oxidase [Ancylobacter crimeensis]MCK0196637.1 alpha-hydroxy-acid oxidizing protein [Ancylobacter crimeensis]